MRTQRYPILFILAVILVFFGCASMMPKLQLPPQEINLNIKGVDTVKVEEEGDGIARSMKVQNKEGALSNLSFILGDRAYITIYGGLSVHDVLSAWKDLRIFKHIGLFDVYMFINSPGGGAFDGLALANHIMTAQAEGFQITAYASGIIASAAVPVFAVCDERIAAPGTIFMVHETTLWKLYAQEKTKDLESQLTMMKLLQTSYLKTLADHSFLTIEEWKEKEGKTTWFSAEKAKSWGLVDRIE